MDPKQTEAVGHPTNIFPSTDEDTKTQGLHSQVGLGWLCFSWILVPVLITSLEKWKCNHIAKAASVHVLLIASLEVLRARKGILSRAGSIALTGSHHSWIVLFPIYALLEFKSISCRVLTS